jgi:glycosyltransferase involved in cell wall biosynthesis
MYKNKKIVVVMPAYNAARTLQKTHAEVMDQGVVDLVVVVDDKSSDETISIASSLTKTKLIRHERNKGYGGNQKTCYRVALDEGADIVIMVHPDYQYTPLLIPAMASLIGNGLYHCVLGSRILGGIALSSGMPWWRYFSNRALTFYQNILLGAKLSEYHTGSRAYSRELLEQIPFEDNSDDFVFDNQILLQILWLNFLVAEITCPTKYFDDASSIGFQRSVNYGLGCLYGALKFRMARARLISPIVKR